MNRSPAAAEPDADYLLGIDTGGTYTDAVLCEASGGVVRSAKALTTREDLSVGIREASALAVGRDAARVRLVSVSTTLATNAIVEGRGRPAALVLVGQRPEALDRAGLRAALGDDPVVFLAGGHGAAGEPAAELDLAALDAALARHAGQVDAFAVAAHFAVRNPAHEIAVRDRIRQRTGLPVTCSHELSPALDAPRRALTALLNARLIGMLAALVDAVEAMSADLGLDAPLMVVKGDGSLVGAGVARLRPVETILSGPAASVVGARHLSGEDDVLVVDMGGTTSDVALLEGGLPRLRDDGASVGGFRTMVSAVAAYTAGVGGDSAIGFAAGGACRVGPRRSVPFSLLATAHPGVGPLLAARRGVRRGSLDDVTLAAAVGGRGEARRTVSRFEAEILDALASGPRWVSEIASDLVMARALERLVRRGMVARAGFTPSDAAHVLGLQDAWPVEIARLGAELWREFAGGEPGLAFEDAGAFCEWVIDGVVASAGRAVLAAALAAETPPGDAGAGALLERAVLGGGELVEVRARLRRPLVAVGAPAATYFPRVAQRLDTRLVLPRHAEVANAVGAVAGPVLQRCEVLVSSPAEGCFRVHRESGPSDHRTFEAARAEAEGDALAGAALRAQRAGATAPRVEARWSHVRAPDGGGGEIFIESRVVATAAGRPRLAARS